MARKAGVDYASMKDELQVTYVKMLEAEQFAQDRLRKESDELSKAKAVLLHEQRHAKDNQFATSAEFSGGCSVFVGPTL